MPRSILDFILKVISKYPRVPVLAPYLDDLLIELVGRRLAVLGARGVGKTHLIKFLTSGTIPVDYRQTPYPEKEPSRRFNLRDLDLKIKDMMDVPGVQLDVPEDELNYADWKEQHDKADLVFYLLRADHLIAGDSNVESRVRDDVQLIASWLDTRSPRPRFFIIGTHCDCDSEFSGLTPNNYGDYIDKFRSNPIVSDLVILAGGGQQTKVLLGSMKTIETTEALVYQVFQQVAS